MSYANSRSVRFQDDHVDLERLPTRNRRDSSKARCKVHAEPKLKEQAIDKNGGGCLQAKVLSRVFSEDYERVKKAPLILDPRGLAIRKWNRVFLVACLLSMFVDPLFFYVPILPKQVCVGTSTSLQLLLTMARSAADVFYIIQIFIRFRTAYVAASSRVFGRGELVIDSYSIARKYVREGFSIDLVAALPLPQLVVWFVIPNLTNSATANLKNVVRFVIVFQYLLRLFLIFPLTSKIVDATGIVTETAWAGAAYNLMLYLLASHFMGACWYLLTVERQEACWKSACATESSCRIEFLNCDRVNDDPNRDSWLTSTNVTTLCDPNGSFYSFGIYGAPVLNNVTSSPFFNQYFYCLWWGLLNLSSTGQNLSTSIYMGENCFAIITGTLGLILFASLIGNMQTYLQSTRVRLEEYRVKRTDTERWMHHRQLPPRLRDSVRRYDQYKWVATRGVNEENILNGLPLDLRRDIKHYLCYDLIRRVPLFSQMDDLMLDAICERLKPTLGTLGTYLVREGDPVTEMLFIIRGNVDSYTTDGGRTGFFNSCRIGPGDFCGEELLTWALEPRPSQILPTSTRTIKAVSEVEAFALRAEDLKFVASQFRKLHSKQLRHKFKHHSPQWRTWAACFIQAAWRRYKMRKTAYLLKVKESSMDANADTCSSVPFGHNVHSPGSRFAICAEMLVASIRAGSFRAASGSNVVSPLQKPVEPDFFIDGE